MYWWGDIKIIIAINIDGIRHSAFGDGHYTAKWITKLDPGPGNGIWKGGYGVRGIDEYFRAQTELDPSGKVEVNVLHFECAAFGVQNSISQLWMQECVHLPASDFVGDWADATECCDPCKNTLRWGKVRRSDTRWNTNNFIAIFHQNKQNKAGRRPKLPRQLW